MNTQSTPRASRGFTLIEMVGVLAVIAVLAALLIPRIFAAINESRLNNAAVSYNTVKSAAMMYFGKYGKFAGVNGGTLATAAMTNWDTSVLLAEGLVEKPFAVKMGAGSFVQVVDSSALLISTTPTGANAAYNLSGAGTNEAASSQYVVEAIITSVPIQDAYDLNKRIDGDSATLGATNVLAQDLSGRVKYAAPTAGATDVHVYIAHK
jgi:prepilin-type N-terminal cleavage/methylation domain-containing protein